MARWMVLTIATALALSGAWGVERPATWGKETACALAQGQGQAWKQVAGKGTVAAEGDALRIKGETLLLAVGLPALTDGEVEARLELLNDDGDIGLVFRADEAGAWQGVHNVDAARHLYHTSLWDLQGAGIKSRRLFDDGTALLRRPKGMDVTLKARFAGKALTLWMDGDPIWSGEAKELAARPGFVGVRTGPKAEVLLKALTVRPLPPPVAVVGGEAPRTVRLARDGLEVTLDARFPAILGYAFAGATLDGAPAPAFRASVNGVDYPATATLKGSPAADSATYAVRVDMGGGREASFDVVFQVLPRATVAMRLERIDDTRCDPILTLNFPDQPLVSARARGPAATLSLSGRYGARHLRVGTDALPAEAATYAQIPILATGALAAALHNNVCNNRMEFTCRALPLPGGETCVGVWNTDFTWQGVDGKPLLPEGEPPTCRIVLTRDANADGAVDWQDGAIALRRLTDGTIPGADRVRRSMVHIGYNFVSEAQNPFLKVADNYRRMANLLDGFEQILLLKGYANEGHDSGHADYADINRRAGGAKDLNLLTDSLARERLGTFGVHINHAEAYPEAKMYDDTVISTKPGWRWMDQSYYIRTYVDIASGRLEKRVDDLFRLCPGIGFVYVDTYRADRYEATRLARAILRHGVLLGTEDAGKLDRWCAWTHQAGAYDPIHRFVYHTQKDVYAASPTHWGGYSRALSMMGWQHGLSPMPLVKDFYTKQLPNKYLMHHPMRRVAPMAPSSSRAGSAPRIGASGRTTGCSSATAVASSHGSPRTIPPKTPTTPTNSTTGPTTPNRAFGISPPPGPREAPSNSTKTRRPVDASSATSPSKTAPSPSPSLPTRPTCFTPTPRPRRAPPGARAAPSPTRASTAATSLSGNPPARPRSPSMTMRTVTPSSPLPANLPARSPKPCAASAPANAIALAFGPVPKAAKPPASASRRPMARSSRMPSPKSTSPAATPTSSPLARR